MPIRIINNDDAPMHPPWSVKIDTPEQLIIACHECGRTVQLLPDYKVLAQGNFWANHPQFNRGGLSISGVEIKKGDEAYQKWLEEA